MRNCVRIIVTIFDVFHARLIGFFRRSGWNERMKMCSYVMSVVNVAYEIPDSLGTKFELGIH